MRIRSNNMRNKSSVLHNIALHCVICDSTFHATQLLNENYIKMANIPDSNDIFIKPIAWYLLKIFRT